MIDAEFPIGGEEAVGAGSTDAVDATGPGAGDHLPLAGEGCAGDPPAIVDLPDEIEGRRAHLVEPHFVEVDFATHMAELAYVDAGRTEVDEKVRDSPALGCIRIGASQTDCELAVVRPRRPDFLATEDPFIAVEFGLHRERCEVRSSTGFGKSWHQRSSLRTIGGKKRRRCSSVPNANNGGARCGVRGG